MSKNIIPFNYFGGKYNHVDWLLKLLPESFSYVEVFGGSGVVLFNKKASRIEFYNDINSTVYNFFKVLREQPEELVHKIFLTPYSMEEYFVCYKNINEGGDLERARRFFVVVGQSFNGTCSRKTGWKMSTKQSRATIAEAVSRWISKIPNLLIIVERLRSVQISKYDFRVMFEKCDSERTLFYCDPPYPHNVRCNNNEYEYEMKEADHIDLLELANNVKGKIAISGYENKLYNSYLKDFYKTIAKEKRGTLFHSKRQEVLWTNYDPFQININLFTN